jgi:hypothetical protein
MLGLPSTDGSGLSQLLGQLCLGWQPSRETGAGEPWSLARGRQSAGQSGDLPAMRLVENGGYSSTTTRGPD